MPETPQVGPGRGFLLSDCCLSSRPSSCPPHRGFLKTSGLDASPLGLSLFIKFGKLEAIVMSEGHLFMKSLVSLPGQNAQGGPGQLITKEEEMPASPSWAVQFLRSCW